MEEETREPRRQLKLSLACNGAVLGMAEAIEKADALMTKWRKLQPDADIEITITQR
ncbi:MAG: hypothetical protein IKD62_07700 [Oscillospiraceae bacterium]|nr:hypothetical protein [Oscillospiraceae bacterium]